MDARVISVNVGQLRTVSWRGKPVKTGIYKEPITGRVPVRLLNLDGDRQADLKVHGGPDKAVYAYAAEHYPYWQAQYPEHALGWGWFGENLTLEGMQESDVHVGDRFRIGTAELLAVQPRFPCFKLGIRFGTPKVVRQFHASDRPGIYFRVVQEGEVGAGDAVTLLDRVHESLSIVALARLVMAEKPDPDTLRRALALDALPDSLREQCARQLADASPPT